MFSMGLIQSVTRAGRFAQRLAGLGGVEFPTLEETLNLFITAGFEIETPVLNGVVTFLNGTRRPE
jgi:hypothetical protein